MVECKKCSDRVKLHVGDKIAFCHNRTYFSHGNLILLAESKGLFTSSAEYPDTKYSVINPNGSKKADYAKAIKLGIPTITPEEFEVFLKRVCPGELQPLIKKPLHSILVTGSRILALELNRDQLETLSLALEKYGAKISNQRRKSLTAVICSEKLLNSGRVSLFRHWNIPVYSYSRVIKTL